MSTSSQQAAASGAAAAVQQVEQTQAVRSRQRWLMVVIIVLALYVARSFLTAVAWAAVLAVSMWPLYARAIRAAPRRSGWIAAGFVLATAVLVMIPIAIVATAAMDESQGAITWVQGVQRTGIAPPPWLGSLPLVGGRARAFWQSHVGTPQAAAALFAGINVGSLLGHVRAIGAQAAQGFVLFLITLATLFAMLVRGRQLATETATVASRGLGAFGERFVAELGTAVRGTVTGTVLVAVGEGVLIGIGYWLAGVPQPLLFTVLTIFVALLPSGAWFAFAVATIVLLVEGHVLPAALLFGWSIAVMVIGDNVIQPAIIGSSVRLPFLFALIGTFGGLETFGLVGLFIGPVIMASLLLAWQQWRAPPTEPGAAPSGLPAARPLS